MRTEYTFAVPGEGVCVHSTVKGYGSILVYMGVGVEEQRKRAGPEAFGATLSA